jgi:hypothetical protein
VAEIEAALTANLDAQENPVNESGLPWAWLCSILAERSLPRYFN